MGLWQPAAALVLEVKNSLAEYFDERTKAIDKRRLSVIGLLSPERALCPFPPNTTFRFTRACRRDYGPVQ
jgi:hypothetical protein